MRVNKTMLVCQYASMHIYASIKICKYRKRDRYKFVVQDIIDRGFKCLNLPLEIGERGFISNKNRGVLAHLCHILKIRKLRNIQKTCSKLALMGTYSIYCARNTKEWNTSRLLKP